MDQNPCVRRGLRSIPTPAATRPRGGSQAPRLPCIRRTETMLDDDLKPQLAAYLERLVRPIVLVASVDDGDKSRELLALRSEEHTSELQSLMRISYAVFCLKKKNRTRNMKLRPNNTISVYTEHHYHPP